MAGFSRFPSSNTLSAFLDSPDPIYGDGADSDALLDGSSTVLGMVPSSSVYSMTRDMYFNNLTINANVRLATNGWRVFVKNLLTFSGSNAAIGFVSGWSTSGSLQQGGAAATSVTHSLGGNASGYTATAPVAALGGSQWFRIGRQAILGYSITASGGPTYLRGGAGGSGQAGGGVVIVAARYISGPPSGTAYIKAPATSPAGGGVVIVISNAAALPGSVATDVTGFNSGTSTYIQVV